MDAIYVTYVDDEHVDNHDHDDTADDDHDNNNDIYVSGPDSGRTRTGPGPDWSGGRRPQVPWYLRQAPMSILSVVQSC